MGKVRSDGRARLGIKGSQQCLMVLEGYLSESGLLISNKETKASGGSSDGEVACDSRIPIPGMGSVPPNPPSPSTSLLTQHKLSCSLLHCS